MKTTSILFFLLLIFSAGWSQVFPEKGVVFSDTEVPKIYVTLHADSLAKLLKPENRYSDHEYPASMTFVSSQGTEVIDNVGFRLRGNTSRDSGKKSFKISFNTFDSGRKFHGLEKMNLNGEHNDPSIVRAKLAFDLMQNAKVPASRSNHVELYVNNEYKGLYMNVEHVDEEFVEARFGNKNGNLYKCLYPSTLSYLGTNADLYKFNSGSIRAYDLKTNNQKDDYSDLANFINVLNNTNPSEFPQKLEPIFNVNSFLKYLVVEILTAHWDGYSYNKNNFYLYKNTATGKFEFIPYDLDNTFGIDWFSVDWAIRNIYNWQASENRPLTYRILQNQVYKDRFSFYMNQVLSQFYSNQKLDTRIDFLKNMITLSSQNDTYRKLDYGWTMTDFSNSYTQAIGNHVKYGVKNFIAYRNNSAKSQLVLNDIAPIVSQVKNTKPAVNQNLTISAFVEDEDFPLNVMLYYQINGGALQTLSMKDDGVGSDSFAQDNIYSANITQPLASYGVVSYYISANDSKTHTTREPAAGFYTATIPQESELKLFINEFMAGNSLSVKDNFGEYEDWIEIYNAGSSPIWLGDKYLTDTISEPDKWQMPNKYIYPGEFLVFWADDDLLQGEMHTNFKLRLEGEEIALFDNVQSAYAPIDYVRFGIQDLDISKGKTGDGEGEMRYFIRATPGYSNLKTNVENDNFIEIIQVFPNPVYDILNVNIKSTEVQNVSISITDVLGKCVFQNTTSNLSICLNLRLLDINSGMYILNITGSDFFDKKIIDYNKKVILK